MCFMILKLTSPAKSLSLIKVTFVDSGDYDENILGPLFSLPQFLRTQISFSISGSSQQDSCHQQYISSSLWHRFVWTNPRSAHLLFSLKFAPKSKFSFSLSTLPFIQFLTLSVIQKNQCTFFISSMFYFLISNTLLLKCLPMYPFFISASIQHSTQQLNVLVRIA